MTSRNLNQNTAAGVRALDIEKTGVSANLIPSIGLSGPGYLRNEVATLGLTTEEVCGRIVDTNLPSGWYAYTDSSFYVPADIPDGSYYFEYQMKIEGVPEVGTGIATLLIGASSQVVISILF